MTVLCGPVLGFTAVLAWGGRGRGRMSVSCIPKAKEKKKKKRQQVPPNTKVTPNVPKAVGSCANNTDQSTEISDRTQVHNNSSE